MRLFVPVNEVSIIQGVHCSHTDRLTCTKYDSCHIIWLKLHVMLKNLEYAVVYMCIGSCKVAILVSCHFPNPILSNKMDFCPILSINV